MRPQSQGRLGPVAGPVQKPAGTWAQPPGVRSCRGAVGPAGREAALQGQELPRIYCSLRREWCQEPVQVTGGALELPGALVQRWERVEWLSARGFSPSLCLE